MSAPLLRLLMTADAVGGVWTYALDLAAALTPLGVTTTLAVLGPAPSDDQRAEAMRAAPGLEVIETGLALDWTAASATEVEAAGVRLAALAAALRPDVVQLNSPALAAVARFPAPVVAVCHSCLATWWRAVRGEAPLPSDFAWRTALTARSYAAADVLVAPSAAFAEATRTAYGLAEAPRVVLNGRAAPPRGGVAPPAAFAFTAGRLWDEGKNVAALDRAAALASTPVKAAGPLAGPDGNAVVLRHAQPRGRLDAAALAAVLADRPVFVSVALYEPFGLAVLEAAQAGCALVLSDIPTFRELWDGAALFVPPSDVQAIAAALDRVAGDPALRARLADAAEVRAARYTAQAMAAGMLAVYREVLARPVARGRAA